MQRTSLPELGLLRIRKIRRLGLLVTIAGFVFFRLNAPWVFAERPEGVAFFESRIRPILIDKCYSCHSSGAAKIKGGLRLDSRVGLLKGGNSGPAIVPGQPGESALLRAIAYTDDFSRMPPREKLPDAVIADFRRWVAMGAPGPRTVSLPGQERKEAWQPPHPRWQTIAHGGRCGRSRIPSLRN